MGERVSSLDTSMNIAALVLAILDKNIKTPEQAFEKLYMKNYTTTTDDVQVMIEMREKGMTYREIGLIYGMTESGVCHKIQRYKKKVGGRKRGRNAKMNNCVLIGRLTKDPDLRYMPNTGTPVANFTLAIDKELSKDKKAEFEAAGKPTADFINIVVWGKQAENCANYLAKGRLAAIQGRIQTRSYEAKDGTRRYVTEVIASQVEFLERKERHNDFDIDGFESVDDELLPF